MGGEQHGEGARARPHGDAGGVAAPQSAGVQSAGVAVGERGEVAAGGADPDGAGAGGAEDRRAVGVAAQGVVEGVQHQRGSSPWRPGPLSRYQRAVPTTP